MLPAGTSLVIAILFIALGIAEMVHPFGPPFLRSNPILLVIAGILIAARYGVQVTARRRARMLAEVPEKPLGLSDD